MERAQTKTPLYIGVICIATYLSNYYLRHVLSVLTPTLLEFNVFSVEQIGLLSSAYMLTYAFGQLVNGFLGDYLSPKKMAVIGICTAGITCVSFPFITVEILQVVVFAVFGFGLSMVRGPLMKIISENTKPNAARTICVFFSFASFAGPLIASLFAIINNWRWVFFAAGGIAIIIAIAAFVALSALEKSGSIFYKSTKGQGIRGIFSVFKIEKFIFFMVIAALVEIGTASISFWIPTFLTDNLKFSLGTANAIFTVISVMRSVMPFVSLAVFRAIKEKDVALMRVSFILCSAFFLCMQFCSNKWTSLLFLILALMAMACSSAVLWSIYIPGLGKTGKVSSVNGVLDCTGYIAASGANMLFAKAMSNIGWNTVLILWASIGIIGVIATLFVKQKKGEV